MCLIFCPMDLLPTVSAQCASSLSSSWVAGEISSRIFHKTPGSWVSTASAGGSACLLSDHSSSLCVLKDVASGLRVDSSTGPSPPFSGRDMGEAISPVLAGMFPTSARHSEEIGTRWESAYMPGVFQANGLYNLCRDLWFFLLYKKPGYELFYVVFLIRRCKVCPILKVWLPWKAISILIFLSSSVLHIEIKGGESSRPLIPRGIQPSGCQDTCSEFVIGNNCKLCPIKKKLVSNCPLQGEEQMLSKSITGNWPPCYL